MIRDSDSELHLSFRGAVCERCGAPLNMNGHYASGYAVIERQNGDRIRTFCRNAVECDNRRRRNATLS